mmetsp:Transcript_5149/g.14740  ORF Transcript_5149/g.14740 Transcript_5149/m.14740 type:complete len:200 (-) Transcript_5149:61-660(-)
MLQYNGAAPEFPSAGGGLQLLPLATHGSSWLTLLLVPLRSAPASGVGGGGKCVERFIAVNMAGFKASKASYVSWWRIFGCSEDSVDDASLSSPSTAASPSSTPAPSSSSSPAAATSLSPRFLYSGAVFDRKIPGCPTSSLSASSESSQWRNVFRTETLRPLLARTFPSGGIRRGRSAPVRRRAHKSGGPSAECTQAHSR